MSTHSKPPWHAVAMDTVARPPSSMTVTSVRQHYELQQVVRQPPVVGDGMTATDWLAVYGSAALGLTLNDIVRDCNPRRPPFGVSRNSSSVFEDDASQQPGPGLLHRPQPVAVSVDTYAAQRVELRLTKCIQQVEERISWLKSGSRKVFGHPSGKSVAVLLDCSQAVEANSNPSEYRKMIKALIHDQLRHKDKILPVSIAHTPGLVWTTPYAMNETSLLDLSGWSQSFAFTGICDVIGALEKTAAHLDDLDCVMVVLASRPSQRSSLIVDYVCQLLAGRSVRLHLVTINGDDLMKACMHELASKTESNYHFYNSSGEDGEEIYSLDLLQLQQELEMLYKTMAHLLQLKTGQVDLQLAEKLHQTRSFTEWPGKISLIRADDTGLEVRKQHQFEERPYLSSTDWLTEYCLKNQGLNIYQLLAPNAIASRRQFVPVLKKDVAAQVHLDRMTQFTWSDGSIKHVHVDAADLHDYQCRLDKMMDTYERRLSWLQSDTRRVFGTVTDKEVLYLVDTSQATTPVLTQLQEHLCQLFGEQLIFCETFNIGCFNSHGVHFFSKQPVLATSENLEAAWRWTLTWQCRGGCDLLGGLKGALEGQGEDQPETFLFDSINVVVCGCPTQAEALVMSYLSQALLIDHISINATLHTQGIRDSATLSKSAELSASAFLDHAELSGYLQRLSQQFDGRFHWYDTEGASVVTSDDIGIVEAELEKAKLFSQKAALLLEHMQLNAERYREEALDKRPAPAPVRQPPPATKQVTGPPRETLSSSTRKAMAEQKMSSQEKISSQQLKKKRKTKQRHPVLAGKCVSQSQSQSKLQMSTPALLTQNSFYLDDGSTGVSVSLPAATRPGSCAVRQAPGHSRKQMKDGKGIGVGKATLQWLKKHSVKAHGLDIAQIVINRDLGNHHSEDVLLNKPFVRSRFCMMYPHVSLSGATYHMQLSHQEIDDYLTRLRVLIRRYVDRLVHLLSGSRRVFGPVLEKKVCILVDISGSVDARMAELKSLLRQLYSDQLMTGGVEFTVIAYNSELQSFRQELVMATAELEHEFNTWTRCLQACGSTKTTEALKVSHTLEGVQCIYLVSDGLPDYGADFVLKQCQELFKVHKLPVHAVSFPSATKEADAFFHKIATITGGRYHCAQPESTVAGLLTVLETYLAGLEDPPTALVRSKPYEALSDCLPTPNDHEPPAIIPQSSDAMSMASLISSLTDLTSDYLSDSPELSERSTAAESSGIPGEDMLLGQQVTASPSRPLGTKTLRLALKDLRGDHLRSLSTELVTANRNLHLALKYRKLCTNPPRS